MITVYKLFQIPKMILVIVDHILVLLPPHNYQKQSEMVPFAIAYSLNATSKIEK